MSEPRAPASNPARDLAGDTGRQVADTGQQVADSRALEWAARLGFGAQGLLYVLVGALAVGIAAGRSQGQADKAGALQTIGRQPFGEVALWVVVVGLLGLALWQAGEAVFGAHQADGGSAKPRLRAAACAVGYGVSGVSIGLFLLRLSSSATKDDTTESKTWSARLLSVTGGRLLLGAIGLAVVVAGVLLARSAWRRTFLQRLDLEAAEARTRRTVELLGLVGGLARAVVVALVGVFLLVAAIHVDPQDAEGVDGTLRRTAQTPFGPVLLGLVAAGLIAYGLFSFAQARFRRS